MNTAGNNPSANVLRAGVTEKDVRDAVMKSGYPLQAVVGNILEAHLSVQPEWSYVDRDEGQIRTLDILAERRLYDPEYLENPRTCPYLAVLVECKQSELPYVFFLAPHRVVVPYFPAIAGLFTDTLTVTTDDSPSTWMFDVVDALGLRFHPFLATDPEIAFSFSKALRKGSGIELSGSEPFHELVLPLMKAVRHFQTAESPRKTALYFHCRVVLGVGVLDAPMVGVRVSGESHEVMLVPWVRVVRHETEKVPDWLHRQKMFAVDLVHKDFLHDYLQNELLPFAETFAALAVKHQDVLASGEAFASGLERDSWQEIEERLQPCTVRAKALGLRMTVSSILRALSRRKQSRL